MKTEETDIHYTAGQNRFTPTEINVDSHGNNTGSNEAVENTILVQLQAIHNTLSLLGDDFLENINTLTGWIMVCYAPLGDGTRLLIIFR